MGRCVRNELDVVGEEGEEKKKECGRRVLCIPGGYGRQKVSAYSRRKTRQRAVGRLPPALGALDGSGPISRVV